MEKEHRISAGAITIQEGKILLVRYKGATGGSYLVGPGGGVLSEEGINQAVVREVLEETGLHVVPRRILFVEDFVSSRYRHIKIWHLCKVAGGAVENTQGAVEEGIVEVGWYSREQLNREVVYPAILLNFDWSLFFNSVWEAKYLEMSRADF
jgi:8-oxo-dGTP diphosphatase